jgi:hypothetical protein
MCRTPGSRNTHLRCILIEAGENYRFSRVSEIMTGKRELSMSMVRKVQDRFHVSADVLIGAPRLRKGLAA